VKVPPRIAPPSIIARQDTALSEPVVHPDREVHLPRNLDAAHRKEKHAVLVAVREVQVVARGESHRDARLRIALAGANLECLIAHGDDPVARPRASFEARW